MDNSSSNLKEKFWSWSIWANVLPNIFLFSLILLFKEQIYSKTYEQIFQKQGLSEEEVGLVVDPNTGLFTAVPEPETAYEANPERLKYIQENINDSNSLDLANFLTQSQAHQYKILFHFFSQFQEILQRRSLFRSRH